MVAIEFVNEESRNFGYSQNGTFTQETISQTLLIYLPNVFETINHILNWIWLSTVTVYCEVVI
jgi:hypothetical protein